MAKLEIVRTGSPVLHTRASEVGAELFGTPTLARLIDDMRDTMRAAPGVGLAAPQVGVPLRIIVLEDTADMMTKRLTEDQLKERERTPFEFMAILNPVLRALSEEKRIFPEGCLSVPGLAGEVERHHSVEVTGLDMQGRAITPWQAHGWPARILQHEVDHLDGVLYFQRVAPGALKSTLDAEPKLIPGATSLDEWLAQLRLTLTPQ